MVDIPADLPKSNVREVPAPEKPDNAAAEIIRTLKATAVKQAMFEVVGENRPEIVKRAAAKLKAMGVSVSESDLETVG